MDLEKNSSCRWQEMNLTASLCGSSMSRYRVDSLVPESTGLSLSLSLAYAVYADVFPATKLGCPDNLHDV